MLEDYEPPDYYAPVHRALIEPVFIGGIPRNGAIVMWGAGAGGAVVIWSPWLLLITLLLHCSAAFLYAYDDNFLSVLRGALHLPSRLEP